MGDDLGPSLVKLMGQVHLNRADVRAGGAQAAGIRQVGVPGHVLVRSQGRADGAGNGVAVAVPAASAEYGAGIEAGAAADALQGLAVFRLPEQVAAAVVYDDQVLGLALPGAVVVGGIGGDRLAGG